MKIIKYTTTLFCCGVLLFATGPVRSLAANGNCTKTIITLAAVVTQACECFTDQNLGGGCPAGLVYNVPSYQKCAAGDVYSTCNNEYKTVGTKTTCTTSYDLVKVAACAVLAPPCATICTFSLFPPNPVQMGACLLCLAGLAAGCAECDLAICTPGEPEDVKGFIWDGETESDCGGLG